MKPRIVVLLSGTLTLAIGYWLSENSRDAREIWLSVGCWVLGFWFASSLLSFSQADGRKAAREEYDEDEEEEEYEEE